jgi:hypothetical protein
VPTYHSPHAYSETHLRVLCRNVCNLVQIWCSLRGAGSAFRPHEPYRVVPFRLLISCILGTGSACHRHELCRGKFCPLPTSRTCRCRQQKCSASLRRALCSRACHLVLPYWYSPQLRMACVYWRGLRHPSSFSSVAFLLTTNSWSKKFGDLETCM